MQREGLSALLIDDSRLDYLHTRGLLLGSRAEVAQLAWFDHWPGADAALAGGPYDLFLIDLHLGSYSGLDVIRELRRAGVLAPIIALTGLADETIDHACTEAGASDFLVKGRFDRQELERSIRYAQRQADVHRELDRLNAALERRATAEGDQARLMRFAIEQSTDAIFLSKAAPTAAEQPVVYVNAAASRLFARRAGDLLGASIGDLLVEPTAALDDAIARQAAFLGDATLVGADGPVDATLQATPLSTGDAMTHYVWTGRPATSAPAGGRHRTRFETVGRITGGVAHELNDRLTAIIGNLELLEAKAGDDDGLRRPVVAALRAAEDLVGQARLLVGLAHRGAGERASFDPTAFVDTIEPLLQHAAGRLTRITRHVRETPPRAVVGDAALLREALILLAGWLSVDGGTIELNLDDRATDADAGGVRLRLAGNRPAADGGDTELHEVDLLVREAGGTFALQRPGDDRVIALVDLPHA